MAAPKEEQQVNPNSYGSILDKLAESSP